METKTYWISDVTYNTNDITLKIVDTDTWQSCYLGLNDHNQLKQFYPFFKKTDLDLIERLRKLEHVDEPKEHYWISAVNYLDAGICVNIMDIETGKVTSVALHDDVKLNEFLPYLKPADVALIERLKLMENNKIGRQVSPY